MTNQTRTVLVTAAVVVAIAAGLGLFLLGRSSTSPTPTQPASTSPAMTPTAVATPTYEPTDPNGSPEPGLQRGLAEAGGGGTKAGPGALPLGYGHDETGAVNAATNYLAWMNSLRISDKSLADEMAAASASDSRTRRALTESFDLLRGGMQGLKVDQPEPARGAYAVVSYTTSQAHVYVWSPEVTTDRSGRTQNTWSIDAVAVTWTDGDWKLDGTLITKTGATAVDPMDPAGDPTPMEKNSILRRTPADPGEITDSADQNWFEYRNAPQ